MPSRGNFRMLADDPAEEPAGSTLVPLAPPPLPADDLPATFAAAPPADEAPPLPVRTPDPAVEAVAPAPADSAGGPPSGPSMTPAVPPARGGELLVQFAPGLAPSAWNDALGAVGGRAEEVLSEHGGAALLRVSLPPGLDPAQAIEILGHRPGVAFAEVNGTASIQAVSNDPYFTNGSLWGMEGDASTPANAFGSQAAEAWAAGRIGSTHVVIGITDTGIDYRHQDLYQNIWLNQREIPDALKAVLVDTDGDGLITFRDLNAAANATSVSDLNGNGRIDAGDLLADARWEDGVDGDGNGYLDDLVGWDFVNNDNDPFDDNGHGTHVAGTIGATGGNGTGVAGIAWNVELAALKFLDASGNGTYANAIRALDYFSGLAAQNTAAAPADKVAQDFVATSNSWGGDPFSQAMLDAIVRGAQQDQLFVAAAGNAALFTPNNNDANPYYPSSFSTTAAAGYEAVISVAATTSTGGLAFFSNYGATSVDLGAPGSGIWSTLPGDSYGSKDGTSMAAPHVAGAIALYAAEHPDATAADIRAAILGSVAPTASLAGKVATGGRLDIGTLLVPDTTPPGVAVTLNDTALTAGETATVTFAFTEKVAGFTLDDVVFDAANGSLGTLSTADQKTYTAVFTPTANIADATNTIAVAAGGYADLAGNPGLAGASANFTIDTRAVGGQTIYGTTAADTLSGGAGDDVISGLPSAGSNLGKGTIDRLTGNAGADLFILGDSRGVFYDDGSTRSAGTSDYALVRDFQDGTDHIQLKGTAISYFARDLSLKGVAGAGVYFDTNGSRAWDSRDELVGVLQGVGAAQVSFAAGGDAVFV